jgi:putative membrane protein
MMNTPVLAAASVFSSDWFMAAASVSGWAFFGVVLCVVALKLFDLITPGKIQNQVFKDGNVAAAVVYAAALLASAIIIASAMH